MELLLKRINNYFGFEILYYLNKKVTLKPVKEISIYILIFLGLSNFNAQGQNNTYCLLSYLNSYALKLLLVFTVTFVKLKLLLYNCF